MTEEEAVRLCNTCTAPASCSEFGRCPLDFPDAFKPCPRCAGPTELRGKSRTPYCRNCHQFIVDGRLGDCRLHGSEAPIHRIRSDESIGRPEDIGSLVPEQPPALVQVFTDDDEDLTVSGDCYAQASVRDDRGADCGGLLICDLDTNHEGPHYCAAEEIWWLPGGSAERHDPTFGCRPIHSGLGDTDEPRWIGPEAY